MHTDFSKFLTQPDDVRMRVYEETAGRLGTERRYVEKDLWVCLVLHTLYNLLPEGHPSLLFKGGTALSKAGGLISRFSEDIDIVVFREWLGYEGDGDPANCAADLSNTRRRALLEEMEEASTSTASSPRTLRVCCPTGAGSSAMAPVSRHF